MKCVNCGEQLNEGCVFCSKCGKEVQMVPDYNVLEDDFLRTLVDEENRKKQEKEKEKALFAKKEEMLRRKAEHNKKIMITVVSVSIALVVILIVVCALLISSKNKNSFSYQVSKAEAFEADKDYDKAIQYYENALSLEPNHAEVCYAIAEIYYKQKDIVSAIDYLNQAIQKDDSYVKAYERLIEVYESKGDTDSIVALTEGVTDESVLELFEAYIVLPPTFSEDAGEFDEVIELSIRASGDYNIYYTLDGKNPVDNGKIYSSPIELEEGEYTVSAVCINGKGIYSEVITNKYTIEIPVPDMPVVSPDGGTFDSSNIVDVEVEVPEGCTAYYTWDGTDPYESITMRYNGKIEVPEGNHVLSVIIINDASGKSSSIYRGRFLYYAD